MRRNPRSFMGLFGDFPERPNDWGFLSRLLQRMLRGSLRKLTIFSWYVPFLMRIS